jgi:hypothetical protein
MRICLAAAAFITVEREAAVEAAQPAAVETLPTAHLAVWVANIASTAEGGVLATLLNALAVWWKLHLKLSSTMVLAARLTAWRVAAAASVPTTWAS